MGASKDLDITLHPKADVFTTTATAISMQQAAELMKQYDKERGTDRYPSTPQSEWIPGYNYDWQADRDTFLTVLAWLSAAQWPLDRIACSLGYGVSFHEKTKAILLNRIGELESTLRGIKGSLLGEGPATEPVEPQGPPV